MTLSTNRESYELGEPLDLMLNLQNNSEKQLIYQSVNSPIFDFWITASNGKEIWRYSKEKSYVGRQELRLAAGEEKDYQAVWNQMDNQGKTVQPGWYEVYARFAGASRTIEPLHTRIKIENRITPSQSVIIVPIKQGDVNPYTDIGKSITVKGILRQSPQGMYIEVKEINLQNR